MMQQRSGRIVNIASIAGRFRGSMPRPMGSESRCAHVYEVPGIELARYGVTVIAVAPGPTDTPMLGHERGR